VIAMGAALGGLIGKALSAQEELRGVSQEAINVSKRSPIALAEINKLGEELRKTGLRGVQLEQALEKSLKKKYGAEAEKDMKLLSVQALKAKENFTLLFRDIKTGPLLEAAEKLFKFLDDSTVEGKALKALLETLLNPIISAIGKAGPAAKKFFQGMLIGALLAAIGILTVKKRLEEITGIKLGSVGKALSEVDWTTIGVAVAAIAIGFVLVAAAITLVVGLLAGLVVLPLIVGAAFAAFASYVYDSIASAAAGVAGKVGEMITAGKNFVKGIAQGIREGASDVVNAAKETATKAVNAIKNALKMHSPSIIGKEIGGNLTGSIAMGQEDEIPQVEGAAQSVAAAMVPQGAALEAGRQPPAQGAGITIQSITINGVEGADDPSFVSKLTEALTQALDVATAGGANARRYSTLIGSRQRGMSRRSATSQRLGSATSLKPVAC